MIIGLANTKDQGQGLPDAEKAEGKKICMIAKTKKS